MSHSCNKRYTTCYLCVLRHLRLALTEQGLSEISNSQEISAISDTGISIRPVRFSFSLIDAHGIGDFRGARSLEIAPSARTEINSIEGIKIIPWKATGAGPSVRAWN